MKKQIIMKKVEKLLEKYVLVLSLEDWSFSISVVNLGMEKLAEVIADGEQRHATIKINKNICANDLEDTIRHELLHVVFAENFQEYDQFNDDLITCLQKHHKKIRESSEEKLVYSLSKVMSRNVKK